MQTFAPFASDGFTLPSARQLTPAANFTFAEATGFTLYWNDHSTHRFGFHANEDGSLRFFGGTVSPASSIPGYLQSLIWMQEKGYHLPPSAVFGLRILHRLHYYAPLVPGQDYQTIPQLENHGFIPVNQRFAETYPHTVWVTRQGDTFMAGTPGAQWANSLVGYVATKVIGATLDANGREDALTPLHEAWPNPIHDTGPVNLNTPFSQRPL